MGATRKITMVHTTKPVLLALTLSLILGLSPMIATPAVADSTTFATTIMPMGIYLYGVDCTSSCIYDQNHVYDFAGNIVGFRSASDPMIICNAVGIPIGFLCPIIIS
jgi:hypothetical protein